MKKYKHKITGKVFIETDFCNPEAPSEKYYKLDSVARNFYLEKEFIVGSNDYEEVKEEPNYLITSFTMKGIGAHRPINADGTYGYTFPFITLKEMLEEGHDIYSVKNSKGEEFTIGEVIGIFGVKFKIDKFEIIRNVIMVYFSDGNNCILEDIEKIKVKEAIYTTTDGVDIQECDNIKLHILIKEGFSFELKEYVYITSFSKEDVEVANRYLTFTSEENRDKYIKENQRKPIFVSADNVEFFESHLGGDYSLFSVLPKANWQENRYRLNDCIKFPKKEWLHFHTKESRQEYIDNNKPKFSLKEIESCYPSPTNSPLFTTFIANLKKLGK